MNQLIGKYIEQGVAQQSAYQVVDLVRELPRFLEQIKELQSENYPNLRAQLEFLLGFVEDVFHDNFKTRPLPAFDEAVFALNYFFRRVDIIPDIIPGIGLLDDSAIARTVLRRQEIIFKEYAQSKNVDWQPLLQP